MSGIPLLPPQFGERGYLAYLNWCIDEGCDRNMHNWLRHRNWCIDVGERFLEIYSKD